MIHRIRPWQSVRFLRVIFPRMVIWKVTKPCMVWRGWVGEGGGGGGLQLWIAWWPPLPPARRPLSPFLPLLPPPASPPIFPFPLSSQRVRFKDFLAKSVYQEVCGHKCQGSTVYSKLQTVFSFKKSSFKCPVLLTFIYIFYSVFEEDNNLCPHDPRQQLQE